MQIANIGTVLQRQLSRVIRTRTPQPVYFLTAVLVSGISSVALALTDDRQQKIKIDSDTVTTTLLSNGNERAEFIGNVVLSQGSLRVTGQKVVVIGRGKDISKVIISGEPAKFEQRPAPEEELVKAQANTMQYLVDQDQFLFQGEASIIQQGSIISSESIEYNLASESVTATNNKDSSSRVKMVFEPTDKKDESQP